jgi:hypothetical protein
METWPSSASVNTLGRPDPDSYSDGDVDQSDGLDGGGDDRAPQFSIIRARRPFKAGFRSDFPDLDLDFDPRDVISMHGRRRGGVSRALLEEVFLTFSGPLVVTEEDEDEEVEDAVQINVDMTVPRLVRPTTWNGAFTFSHLSLNILGRTSRVLELRGQLTSWQNLLPGLLPM